MRVYNLAALFIALPVVALTVQAGAAANPIFCCACLANNTNHTAVGTVANDTAVALDCAQVATPSDFQLGCAALGGAPECFSDGAAMPCAEVLAGEGIQCPTTPAPAAGAALLVTLAVVLGGLGTGLLRRRRRVNHTA